MKLKINVKSAGKDEAETTAVSLEAGAEDTVLSVKERIHSAQIVAFPEQDLLLHGRVLAESSKLVECGVEDGTSLDCMVRATESSLVEQLQELLQAREFSCDELGLLYCYKHGVSIKRALLSLGVDGRFQDFLGRQKQFHVENGKVHLRREEAKASPFSVRDEVRAILEAAGGTLDLAAVSARFVRKFNTSVADVAGMRLAEFLEKEKDTFVICGPKVSLKGVVPDLPPGLGAVAPRKARAREGVVPALPPGLGAPTKADHPWCPSNTESARTESTRTTGSEAPSSPTSDEAPEAVDAQQYLDLHTKISGRSFNSKVAMALNELVDIVTESLFVKVDQVVKSGSVGKGTAISGVADAEVVFFLAGVVPAAIGKWLPPLLQATAAVLTQTFTGDVRGTEVQVTRDSVRLTRRGLVSVDLRFAPSVASHSEALALLRAQDPATRRHLAPVTTKEKTLFVGKQPGQVKVTMRLLKWWRDQQEWSRPCTTPSDEVLELVAVYSAAQHKPVDQRAAIASVMALLAKFEELRVVWTNYYEKEDVWPPLLQHRPLLMDPTNPFVNVADPQAFDARELMEAAKTTHFFW